MDKIAVLVLALVLLAPAVQGFTAEVFTKDDCGACENMLEYIDSVSSKYPKMELVIRNVTADMAYFNETARRLGMEPRYVPMLVVGNDYHIGFADKEEDGKRITTILSKANSKPAAPATPAPVSPPVESPEEVVLTLFWGVGCPHCAAEKEFLSRIESDYPELVVEMYEINYNQTNLDLLLNLSAGRGFEASSIPVTLVGDWHYIGYNSDEIDGAAIEAAIRREIAALKGENLTVEPAETNLVVDVFGSKIDLGEMGIPLSTVVIGLADGFNPCAFFVLMMLLSFMIYARSRTKMLVIGLTFVFISGLVYFMFMTAMFSAIRAINEIRLVALVGGVIALAIGLINLKDFFFYKKGVSLTIPESKKPGLYKRMRELLKSESMVKLWVSTVILAFVANSYELLCTAGFPIVYGNLLNTQQLNMWTSVMYIALYNVFYVMPLLIIVLLFIRTLHVEKMTEEKGELLKSISGIMMLGFGIFLIFDPHVLSNIFVAIGLIGGAVIISLALERVKKSRKAAEGQTEQKSKAPEKPKRAKKRGTAKKPKV